MLTGAGYDLKPHILSRPYLRAATDLGTLNEHDSQRSTFRRILEKQGAI